MQQLQKPIHKHRYIGDLNQYLKVEQAKSGRSQCRKCKQEITKNQVRIGIMFDDQKFSTSNWFHLDCFHFKPRHKVIRLSKVQDEIEGIQDLSQKDYDIVLRHLQEDLKDLKRMKPGQRRKQIYGEQYGQNNRQNEISIPKNEEAEKKKKIGKKLVRTTTKKLQTHHLTAHQNRKYNNLIGFYHRLHVHQLKSILAKNGQIKTGHKEELVARCADGKQFGAIPPCPKCGGGHLHFDRQSGIYTCPGYMEDTDFVHCNSKFGFYDVKRLQWLE